MKTNIYINGMNCISPQHSFDNKFFSQDIDTTKKKYLQIIAPKYKDFIPVIKLRRMAKIMRLGLIGAKKAMEDANTEDIDAIIIGTGYGNIGDTEKFLNAVLDNKEQMLVPTSFVQSTHNIVSGSIALMHSNKNYNMTYTHHNSAFEMSLLDAIMLINNNEAKNVLIAGIDEITEHNYTIKETANKWRNTETNPLEIFNNPEKGRCLPGESSCFFVVSKYKNENSYATITDVLMFHNADGISDTELLKQELIKENININEIDLVIGGFNGDTDYDNPLLHSLKSILPQANYAAYKQYVGEHPTASAFGLWMAVQILSGNTIENNMWYIKPQGKLSEIKNILIIQKSFLNNGDWALMLVRSKKH